ncbi:FG-GAP and VCBS repeat-containing protein [Streptomyces sp. NPDC058620]|uniref:FG-GAP and VCBS repeat-containing protein n=1 Tax=Streptomyces sp. NPDC058620 TaxID=3346560 RepID=UPI00364D8349
MRTTVAIAALLTAGLTPLTLTSPASAAAAKHFDDFNGDGYRDLAAPHMYSGMTGGPVDFSGGAVLVTFGGPAGLTTRTQLIHQDSAGVPGVSEGGDQFGQELASADLNSDGYADLVVGNPSEESGTTPVGSVTLLWGSSNGLGGGTALPRKNGGPWFGRDLATGDFNGDGKADIAAISGSDAYLYRGGFTKTGSLGAVTKYDKEGGGWYSDGLAAGKVTGDGKTDLVILGTHATDITVRSEAWFLKGTSGGLTSGPTKVIASTYRHELHEATIGDFDKNGYGDIAVANPYESSDRGTVTLWYGTSTGPGSKSAKLSQATSGVVGAAEPNDGFGSALSAGDTDGDGYADLAVGVPGESVGTKEYAGGAHLFRGGSGGLSGARSAMIDKTLPGVAGGTVAEDMFGSDLRVRDLNRDGKAELTVLVPWENAARVLPGANGGVTGLGSYIVIGISGLPE